MEGLEFLGYSGESDLEQLMELIQQDLSEPYSVFTYRYFLGQWPDLATLVCSNCISQFIIL
jgi:peptide alpha-N-acetyltransferase